MRASVVTQAAQLLLENPGGDSDGRGIAAAYAELCAQANDRLSRCAGFARSGRLVESIHLADESPNLLELCTQLDFSKAAEWRDLCGSKKWPVAQPIDADAINVLNDAYGSGIPLDPLLQEYRAAMSKRDRRSAILILRRLAQIEPDNSTWGDDLAAFEARRIEEIATTLADLDRQGALDELTALATELNGIWAHPVPQELVSQVERALTRAERRHAEKEIQQYALSLANAYAAKDINRCEEVLGRIDAILVAYSMHLEPDTARHVRESREWVRDTRAHEAEEQAYQQAFDRLTAAVEHGSGSEAEAALDGLARFNRKLPEGVETRAMQMVEDYHVDVARAQRLRVIGSVVAVLMVMAGCIWTWLKVTFQRQTRTIAEEVSALHASGDLRVLTNRLATIRILEPRVWETAALQEWVTKSEQLAEDWRREDVRRQALLMTLEEAMAGTFTGEYASTESLLEQARQSCGLESAAAADNVRFNRILQAWNEESQKRQGDADRRWASTQSLAKSVLDEASAAVASGLATEQTNLVISNAAQHVAQAVLMGKGNEWASAAEALEVELQRIRTSLQERDALISTLSVPNNLKQYFDSAAVLARAYPQHPLVAVVSPFLQRRVDFEALDAGPLQATVMNRFWGEAAAAINGEDRDAAVERWTTAKEEILAWAEEPLLVDVYAFPSVAGGVSRTVIIRGKPQLLDTGDYAFSYYDPAESKDTIDFKTSKQRTGYQLSTLVRLAYCEVVEKVLAELRHVSFEAVEPAITDAVKAIATSSVVPDILKARLMEELFRKGLDVLGNLAPVEWRNGHERLVALDHEIHWLCRSHYAYKKTEILAGQAVAASTPDSVAMAIRRQVAYSGRFRSIQFLGIAPFTERAGTLPNRASAHREIWVMRPDTKLGERVFILAEQTKGTTKRPQFVLRPGMLVQPGEPLFAPQNDDSTSAEGVALIARRTGTSVEQVLRQALLSHMWPANVHE